MSGTTLIIIGLACVCFHLRKLRENIEKQNKSTSTYNNNVKFRKVKKFVIKKKQN